MPTKARTLAQRRPQPHRTPDLRATSSARGYDAAWRRLRLAYLRQHPLCVVHSDCGLTAAAMLVDHVTPVAVEPSRRLDPTNLRGVCRDCHADITGRYRAEGVNQPTQAYIDHLRRLATGSRAGASERDRQERGTR